jgi:hypothetical protein
MHVIVFLIAFLISSTRNSYEIAMSILDSMENFRDIFLQKKSANFFGHRFAAAARVPIGMRRKPRSQVRAATEVMEEC